MFCACSQNRWFCLRNAQFNLTLVVLYVTLKDMTIHGSYKWWILAGCFGFNSPLRGYFMYTWQSPSGREKEERNAWQKKKNI